VTTRPAAVLLAVGLVAVAGAASAVGADQPDRPVCTYDESELQAYQPETAIGHLDIQPTASYAGIFTSPARETTIYVYFLRYPRQEGATAVDSHVDDREPVYVLVDDRTGDVQRVLYSEYHYAKGAGTPSQLPMNGSHVRLHVVEPWHQYVPSPAPGARVRLANYCEAVDSWHANGWRASEAATTDPWTMTDRDSWWRTRSLSYSLSERYRESRRSVADAVSDINVSVPSVSETTLGGTTVREGRPGAVAAQYR